jgi:hypothetical protein
MTRSIVLALVALGGCSDGSPRSSTPSTPPPSSSAPAEPAVTPPPAATARRHVVPLERAADYGRFAGHDRDAEYFVPSAAEVAAFEAALPAALRAEGTRGESIASGLASYGGQLVGIVKDGRRIVFGNFFCGDDDPAGRPVLVKDGGACYFHAGYEPGSGLVVDLTINGDA